MAGPHPITGVLEKAFAIVNMLNTRKYVTVYDIADELHISRSIAHKYMAAATLVLPVFVRNEKHARKYNQRFQYTLLRKEDIEWEP